MMKCLLVAPIWDDLGGVLPRTGRPHLDLLMWTLGFQKLDVKEITPGSPFDPNTISAEYPLIVIQGGRSGRLKRSVLSNLGLSLWLDEAGDSDQLRVTGALPLLDGNGTIAGFTVKRSGRVIAFCEGPVWELRHELVRTVRHFQREEEIVDRQGRRPECWMIESGCRPFDLSDYLEGDDYSQCELRELPNGDTALLLPAIFPEMPKEGLASKLGPLLYARTPIPLEELVGDLFVRNSKSVAVAESCTAGLVSARLAAVPGSSAYLMEGATTYSNASKVKYLEGSTALLKRCGAVSPEIAVTLARGALRSAGTDCAVSVTGIAGPGGGSAEKPVGTVYLAAVSLTGGTVEAKCHFEGGRDRVRWQASQTALHLLRRVLLGS
ncbi:MAG: nicotinamide-nucleotide amidohydrolase family protein [Magnetococcales bacterium]|nr:nicotinamide-nucleotide amidohydrolase family protein [Magnetococcales bacterium]